MNSIDDMAAAIERSLGEHRAAIGELVAVMRLILAMESLRGYLSGEDQFTLAHARALVSRYSHIRPEC